MQRKGLSPVIATVILVAVAITVAVAAYGVMTGEISKEVGFFLFSGVIIVLLMAVAVKKNQIEEEAVKDCEEGCFDERS